MFSGKHEHVFLNPAKRSLSSLGIQAFQNSKMQALTQKTYKMFGRSVFSSYFCNKQNRDDMLSVFNYRYSFFYYFYFSNEVKRDMACVEDAKNSK